MATPDDMTLEALVDALAEDVEYSTGHRPAPRRATPSEALNVIDDIFTGCRQSDALMPEIAEGIDREIACHRKCPGGCCEQLVLISMPEGMAIAAELGKRERAGERHRFLAQLRGWKDAFGERAEEGAQAFAEGRMDDYERIQAEHAADFIMCPMGHFRDCGVYDVRPLTCRQLWVVDTWEGCGAPRDGAAPKQAEVLSHPSVDDLYTRAKRVSRGLQSALEMGTTLHPLPLVVLALLEGPAGAAEQAPDESARNDESPTE